MPNNLQHVAASAPKNKEIACVRIAAERLLNLECKPIHAPAHVRPPDRQPDARARRKRDHDRTRAFTIAEANSGVTVGGKRSCVVPPTMISIIAEDAGHTAERAGDTTTCANPEEEDRKRQPAITFWSVGMSATIAAWRSAGSAFGCPVGRGM